MVKNLPAIQCNVGAAAAAKSLQSCPTLCDPMDYSLPGSTIHGIFQARVLEWVAIAFSTMQETWFQSLDQEDPLEKAMATHSSILAWKIPWMVEPGRVQSLGSQRVGRD